MESTLKQDESNKQLECKKRPSHIMTRYSTSKPKYFSPYHPFYINLSPNAPLGLVEMLREGNQDKNQAPPQKILSSIVR